MSSMGMTLKIVFALAVLPMLLIYGAGCEKFRKISGDEVAIELKTPGGQTGRGIGNLKITPEGVAITSDRLSVCSAEVPPEAYQELIHQLNQVGFIFMESRRDLMGGQVQPFSLTVTEHKNGKTRTNTVYWEGQGFPDKAILLQLNQIRHHVHEKGECTGNVPIGDPCQRDDQCRTGCCKQTSAEQKTCVLSTECAKKDHK